MTRHDSRLRDFSSTMPGVLIIPVTLPDIQFANREPVSPNPPDPRPGKSPLQVALERINPLGMETKANIEVFIVGDTTFESFPEQVNVWIQTPRIRHTYEAFQPKEPGSVLSRAQSHQERENLLALAQHRAFLGYGQVLVPQEIALRYVVSQIIIHSQNQTHQGRLTKAN